MISRSELIITSQLKTNLWEGVKLKLIHAFIGSNVPPALSKSTRHVGKKVVVWNMQHSDHFVQFTKIELSIPVPKILSVVTIIEDCWWNNKHTNRSRSPLQSLLRLTSWRRLGSELDEEDRAKPISLCAVAMKCRDVARVTFWQNCTKHS